MARYNTELETALQISKLYYIQNYTQQEISEQYGLSRAKVQRLLQKARDTGMVKIEIVSPFPYCDDLAREICLTFPIQEAIIIPVQTEFQTSTREELGSIAADYIASRIMDGQIIGIGWGKTIYEVVRFWNTQKKAQVKVVPLFGGFGQTESCYQTNDMAMRIAASLGGTSHPLFAPVIVENKILNDALFNNQTIKQVTELWNRMDAALLGFGSSLSISMGDFWKRCISEDTQQELVSKGVVGDLALNCLNQNGEFVDTSLNGRLINIKMDQLKRIPLVIGVGGGMEKVPAIVGTLKTGIVHVLITDQLTAKAVLEASSTG